MPSERIQQFLEMVKEFPDSPMGHFSLGRAYLDEKHPAEAAQALERAVALDPNYAAALVALGDAHAAAGDSAKAKDAYARALATPHGKKDQSLQFDIEQRIQELE